jgi:mono/diheme cytochrome c family protein
LPNGPDLGAISSGQAAAGMAAAATPNRRSLITALVVLAAVACAVLALVLLQASRNDPYTSATLDRVGSVEDGGRLFRLNCAGCHGLAAQGLVAESPWG